MVCSYHFGMTNKKSITNKKEQVLHSLFHYLTLNEYKKGDRISSERELAQQCKTSRATLREIIRSLEAKGLFKIKQQSGIFLIENPQIFINEFFKEPPNPQEKIADILETALLIYPIIIHFAIKRSTVLENNTIQNHIVQLSRGILEKDLSKIIEYDRLFYTSLAKMTKNQYLINLVTNISSSHSLLLTHILNFGDFAINSLFASYIGIAQSVKNQKINQATFQIQEKYKLIFKWLNENNIFTPKKDSNEILSFFSYNLKNNFKEEL